MNQQHNITTGPHRWKKGETGNPAGRPLGARQRISEKLLADLADVWQEHGKAVLTRLVSEDPGKLAQIAFGLLPRDVFVSVEQTAPGNLDPETWKTLRSVLDLIERCAPAGVDTDDLHADLTSCGYKYDSSGRLCLESKQDMRKRGMPSPDSADAMALCFS